MIDRTHQLSITRQAEALAISRSSVYYQPRTVSEEDLTLMRMLDELHLECSYAGSRMLRDLLHLIGIRVGRRRTLMRRMSIMMDVQFCLDTVQEAIDRCGAPEIFNTDQGSQFTSLAFTELLKAHEIRISMDGKGCWRDNVFVERLWRTIKYEEVYLRAYESVSQAKDALGRYLAFYITRRPHSRLDRMTPDMIYFNQPPHLMAA